MTRMRLWPATTLAAVVVFLAWWYAPAARVERAAPAATAPAAAEAAAEAAGEGPARLRIDPTVVLPGDAHRGWKVFDDQKCLDCHAIWGTGGTVGPDLGRVSMQTASIGELVAAFWNHGPRMWAYTQKSGRSARMTTEEAADLMALLTFVKALDPVGDPARGLAVLAERRCLDCHLQGSPGRIPNLSEWAESSNPVAWLHRMWSHAPEMEAEAARRGIPWPRLEPTDLSDIISYVRTVARPEGDVLLRPGSPQRGERAFFREGCAACHVIEGRGAGGIDLSRRDYPRTLSGLAARLWNHYPSMRRAAGGRAGAVSRLSPQKTADLLSFLFSVRYLGEKGDAARGAAVFRDRGCVRCHGDGEGRIRIGSKGNFSTVEMVRSLWNHGPQMAERMAASGVEWPQLEGDEVLDVIRYINEAP